MEQNDQPPSHPLTPYILAGVPWGPFSGPFELSISQQHHPCRPLWENVASWGLHPLSLVTPSAQCPDLITLNPATAPACRSDSMFPGSRKAMLMRKPGPVKAHSFRKLNVPCRWECGERILGVGATTASLGPPPVEPYGAYRPRLASLSCVPHSWSCTSGG